MVKRLRGGVVVVVVEHDQEKQRVGFVLDMVKEGDDVDVHVY